MEELTITRHEQNGSGEYRAHVAGHEHSGMLSWVQHGDVRSAEHTVVPNELRGRGIAERLVLALIEDARAQGFRIHPACSYVAVAFQRHPEWADLQA